MVQTGNSVIAYIRVSTEDQARNGISLEAQRHRIEAYCAAHGYRVAHVAEDAGISARTTKARPGLQCALQALTRGEADGLVVVKLDRLSRTTRDVLDLVARSEREGWALHSIEERLDTSSAHGRFVVTVLGALAQLEREQAADRTRAAMAELRRQGRRISGKPPLGYRFEAGRLVEAPEEARALAAIEGHRARGWKAKRIATALNAAGILNPRTGDVWRHGTVRDILLRLAAAS